VPLVGPHTLLYRFHHAAKTAMAPGENSIEPCDRGHDRTTEKVEDGTKLPHVSSKESFSPASIDVEKTAQVSTETVDTSDVDQSSRVGS
jgi:hypothetical protein